MPKTDLDPDNMKILRAAWATYRNVEDSGEPASG